MAFALGHLIEAHTFAAAALAEAEKTADNHMKYLSLGNRAAAARTLAQRAFERAFERALEVRRRIEHPGASETENWLKRLS